MSECNQRAAMGGLVFGREAYENGELPAVGDIVEVNGRGHAVLGVSGHYDLKRDRWTVDYKLGAIREPKFSREDPPEWVEDAVMGASRGGGGDG